MFIPASFKILICFALILILNRIRFPLSASLLTGAAALGLWTGMNPAQLADSFIRNLAQWDTIYLVIIFELILLLSRLMEQSGHLQRIVYAFVLVIKDRRLVSALVPALIAVLPMPGGALFSAPMLEKVFGDRYLKAEHKAIINYWFRHLWEYWWPLYPGFILAVSLLRVPAWKLMLVQLPLAVFCLVAGFIFLLLPLKRWGRREGPPLARESIRSLLWEVMPLSLVVLVILLLELIRRGLRGMGYGLAWPSGTPILLGMIACLLWVLLVNRLTFRQALRALRGRQYLTFGFLVLGIMIFRGVLKESSMVPAIKEEFLAYHIPFLLIVALLPFISGLVTGIAIGFVGASFPVILPLLGGLPPGVILAYGVLAYSFGYMGMMLSPIHLCFVVSKDYFHASFPSCYRFLVQPVLLVFLLNGLYFIFLTNILWPE